MDVTTNVGKAVQFLQAYQISTQKGRAFPFPVLYIFREKLAKKLPKELEAYFAVETQTFEEFADKDAEGKAIRTTEGGWQLSPEGIQAINDRLTPLQAESLTVSNVRKVRPEEFGDMMLSDAELAGYEAFIENGD